MTRNGFYKLLEKAARAAGIADVHPHLLRHGCGFKLVNQGMDTLSLAAYLGHVNVQNTQRYTRMSAIRRLMARLNQGYCRANGRLPPSVLPSRAASALSRP